LNISIAGTSIAGLCTARLLAKNNIDVELFLPKISSSNPIVVLNGVTVSLILDIWRMPKRSFDYLPMIEYHHIKWGEEEERARKERSVITENLRLIYLFFHILLDQYPDLIHAKFIDDWNFVRERALKQNDKHTNWMVDASGKIAIVSKLYGSDKFTFGKRHLVSGVVPLKNLNESNSSWIETTMDGWIYLAQLGERKGLIQAMIVDQLSLEEILTKTHIIKRYITKKFIQKACFNGSPTLLNEPCGPGWMAVGEAAISFDPISGEGVGNAIRGAMWTSSILKAVISGFSAVDCLKHYSYRLKKAFFHHLNECINLYSIFSSASWKYECDTMQSFSIKEDEKPLFGMKGDSIERLTSNIYDEP
jgi:flavin-dependent dehydrogenase